MTPNTVSTRYSISPFKTCLQEMGENGFDHAHFQFVHSHPKVGTVEKIEFRGFDRTVLTSQKFPSSKGPVDARIDIFGRGPGMAVTRYHGLIDASLIGCSTPVDEETSHLTFLFSLKNPDQDQHVANIAKAFVSSVTSEVGQDIPIWENKRYQPIAGTGSERETDHPVPPLVQAVLRRRDGRATMTDTKSSGPSRPRRHLRLRAR